MNPGPHDIPTETVEECDLCGGQTTVTYWDNILTGRWERPAWTCACGEHHTMIHGDDYERG